ncbi:MAG: YpmA family protein [Eubacteriales bacterium]
MDNEESGGSLVVIAAKLFKEYDEMYKVVDFLNKSLKNRNIIFGLTREPGSGKMKISIYET